MAEPVERRSWRRLVHGRLAVVAVLLAVWAVAVESQLVNLQVFQFDRMTAEAESQQQDLVTVPARRGEIVDRRGRVLAISVDTDSVWAAGAKLGDIPAAVSKICGALGGCDPDESRGIVARLRRTKFAPVRRSVRPSQARAVAALKLNGVEFLREPRRFYPNTELAAHVLGCVSRDGRGLEGLEAAYDAQMRGRDGTMLVQYDGQRHTFSRVGEAAVPGASLELTIDAYLQHIVERELATAVAEHRAAGGSVVMMDPATGEILAMASVPSFDPNAFARVSKDDRRNRAVQDVLEPGSTFKMITATAALEERVYSPSDVIDTGDGVLRMGARTVRDTHGHGAIPLTDVIVLSSNIGAIKIGWRLGSERLGRHVKDFGFGTRLSPDFPGENAGIVWDPARWTPSGALASVAMGYEISVTPLQMAAAASAIANGGELVQPRVVRALVEGGVRRVVPRKVLRRVMSPETSGELTSMLEGVVDRGTATSIKVEGFTAAGKTGTAAKLEGGVYSKSLYNASFVGFIPSRNPVLAIFVVLDSPRTGQYYGGVVSAPVFARIADAALRYLAVPPTLNPPSPVLVARGEAPAGVLVGAPAQPLTILAPLVPPAEGQLVLPELRGLGGREALRILAGLGVAPRMTGEGIVLDQDPPAGTPVDVGASCRLSLGRGPFRQAGAGGVTP